MTTSVHIELSQSPKRMFLSCQNVVDLLVKIFECFCMLFQQTIAFIFYLNLPCVWLQYYQQISKTAINGKLLLNLLSPVHTYKPRNKNEKVDGSLRRHYCLITVDVIPRTGTQVRVIWWQAQRVKGGTVACPNRKRY